MIARDFVGYGQNPPKITFPNHARIALNFVINYEEGAEHNILEGDSHSESYLVDIPNIQALDNQRNLSCESMFEYGSRCGIWRLVRLFDDHEIPLSFFICGLAIERNLEFADYLKQQQQHAALGHAHRWIDYRNMPKAQEREYVKKTIDAIQELTNKTVYGWYTGRSSENTRALIIEAGLQYDSENYSDDLPHWISHQNKPHLVIPYCLVNNDCRYSTAPGYASPKDFYHQLKMNFDYLYHEGKKHPKIMTVGLHPRLSGKPARSEALRAFIKHVTKHDKVWICNRDELANFWQIHHPATDTEKA